jgi:IS5 family transposase
VPPRPNRIHRHYRTKRICYPEIRKENREKSRTRSRIEHVSALIKLRFGFTKIRYRGLLKNANRLFATCALANLLTARSHLLQVAAQTCA